MPLGFEFGPAVSSAALLGSRCSHDGDSCFSQLLCGLKTYSAICPGNQGNFFILRHVYGLLLWSR